MTKETQIDEESLVPEEENPELWERVLMMVGVIGFKEEKTWIEEEREKIWEKIEKLPEEIFEIPEEILNSISQLMEKVLSETNLKEFESVLNLIPATNEDFILFRNRIALLLTAHFDLFEDDLDSKKGLLDEFSEYLKEEFVGFEEDYESAYDEFDISLSLKEDFFLANFFPERYEADIDEEEE